MFGFVLIINQPTQRQQSATAASVSAIGTASANQARFTDSAAPAVAAIPSIPAGFVAVQLFSYQFCIFQFFRHISSVVLYIHNINIHTYILICCCCYIFGTMLLLLCNSSIRMLELRSTVKFVHSQLAMS